MAYMVDNFQNDVTEFKGLLAHVPVDDSWRPIILRAVAMAQAVMSAPGANWGGRFDITHVYWETSLFMKAAKEWAQAAASGINTAAWMAQASRDSNMDSWYGMYLDMVNAWNLTNSQTYFDRLNGIGSAPDNGPSSGPNSSMYYSPTVITSSTSSPSAPPPPPGGGASTTLPPATTPSTPVPSSPTPGQVITTTTTTPPTVTTIPGTTTTPTTTTFTLPSGIWPSKASATRDESVRLMIVMTVITFGLFLGYLLIKGRKH